MDNNKFLNRNDVRWSHPAFSEYYYINGRDSIKGLTDPNKPLEKRIASRDKACDALKAGKEALLIEHPEYAEQGETKDFYVPGCPEEPDTQAHVLVRFPKKRRKKSKVLFYIAGGAFLFGSPYFGPIEEYCYNLDCVVVSPWYRTGLDAPYPAAVNDIHAAYKWMVDNASELGINPDKVVLSGLSAGGFFSLAVAFRLKRYGYSPRGAVIMDPAMDERNMYLSNYMITDAFDAAQTRAFMTLYLGPENYVDPHIGPEAVPGRATVEDCKGLCPIIIHTVENDYPRDNCIALMNVLHEAGVYTESHIWGGAMHSTYYAMPEDVEQRQRYMMIFEGNIKDLWKYDMRRKWLWEEE